MQRMEIQDVSPKRKAEDVIVLDDDVATEDESTDPPQEKKAKTESKKDEEYLCWTLIYEEPCDTRVLRVPLSAFGSKPSIPNWARFREILANPNPDTRLRELCDTYEQLDIPVDQELDVGVLLECRYALTTLMYE